MTVEVEAYQRKGCGEVLAVRRWHGGGGLSKRLRDAAMRRVLRCRRAVPRRAVPCGGEELCAEEMKRREEEGECSGEEKSLPPLPYLFREARRRLRLTVPRSPHRGPETAARGAT